MQRLGQKQCRDAADKKQYAQNVVGRSNIHGGAQVNEIWRANANGICENRAQRDARLTHAGRINLHALQIDREEGQRIEELDESGQTHHDHLIFDIWNVNEMCVISLVGVESLLLPAANMINGMQAKNEMRKEDEFVKRRP